MNSLFSSVSVDVVPSAAGGPATESPTFGCAPGSPDWAPEVLASRVRVDSKVDRWSDFSVSNVVDCFFTVLLFKSTETATVSPGM